MSSGMFPDKLLLSNCMDVTLSRDTVMPYHSFTGFDVNHLSLFVQLSPSVLLYKATKARESFSLTLAKACDANKAKIEKIIIFFMRFLL